MANEKENKDSKDKRKINARNKENRNISGNLNAVLSNLSSTVFGTSGNSDVEDLNKTFNDIIKNEQDSFNRSESNKDTNSFISNLFRDSNTATSQNNDVIGQINNMFDNSQGESTFQSFMTEAYRNKLLKQSDLHEIASQLVELREAILITRDAIISSDIVEGKMTRLLTFEDTGEKDRDNNLSIVEALENKFNLQDKIKNFIVPKTLEFGEYYAYVMPYSKIFSDFMKAKESNKLGYNMYHETTLYEFVTESGENNKKDFQKNLDSLFESVDNDFPTSDIITRSASYNDKEEKKGRKKSFDESVEYMMKNITICNDPMPLNVLEEGVESIAYFAENCVDPGNNFNEKKDIEVDNIGSDSYFNRVIKSANGDGVYSPGSNPKNTDKSKTKDEFKNIHDCYLKLLAPTKLVPVQIMSKRIGYYYVQVEESTPITGVMSSSLYFNRFEDNRRERTVIDTIASQIVKSFDKKFLENNMKFKALIVEALNYYNLTEQRVRFQFIPEEYIVPFKVSEDEEGNGTSILEPSLFYAKLYLMLLLFKMMSIILYSNDQRINYVKTSGIDKNVRKKIEEIARKKQERSITVMDLFSYTSLVNKLGVGAETYIPTGKSGERGLETEVIQGQSVEMNNDLMDNLKKSYILGTGVPDAIMNYMNEADFAKSLELANTRFQGRVVSYQFDFNKGITDLYRRLLRWSTSLPDSVIEGFNFAFSPPKASAGQIKGDFIQNFETYSQWVIALYFGQQNLDNPDFQDKVLALKKKLARDYMPMINFDKLDAMVKEANIDGTESIIKPKGKDPDGVDADLSGL